MKKDTIFLLGLALGGTLAYLNRNKLEETVLECTCKLNDVINKKEENSNETYGTFAEDFENNQNKSSKMENS